MVAKCRRLDVEPPVRIELTTFRLQGGCSTTELRRRIRRAGTGRILTSSTFSRCTRSSFSRCTRGNPQRAHAGTTDRETCGCTRGNPQRARAGATDEEASRCTRGNPQRARAGATARSKHGLVVRASRTRSHARVRQRVSDAFVPRASSVARPASRRATGTRKGEQDT